jgi:DNA replication licensing factor MCM4
LDDIFASFKDFLRNFTKKYRMYRDGFSEADVASDPDAESKPYWEALENMLLLGTTKLYLDVSDLNIYPPTRKLWYQVQVYPAELIHVMDQSVHDMMMELARADSLRNRPSQSSSRPQASHQSSEPNFPSSDRPDEAMTPRTPAETPAEQPASMEDQVAAATYVVRPFGLEKSINLRDLNPSGTCKL